MRKFQIQKQFRTTVMSCIQVTALGTGVSTARLFDCAANSIAKQYQFYTTLKSQY